MPKNTPSQLRQRLIEIAHDLLVVRDVLASPRLTCGGDAPVVFRRAYESTASMLEAEAIMFAEELGILAAPPAKAEAEAIGNEQE